MARHGPKRVEHARVLDAALDQVPLDHPVPGPRGRVVRRCRFLGLGRTGTVILILGPRPGDRTRLVATAKLATTAKHTYPDQQSHRHGGSPRSRDSRPRGRPLTWQGQPTPEPIWKTVHTPFTGNHSGWLRWREGSNSHHTKKCIGKPPARRPFPPVFGEGKKSLGRGRKSRYNPSTGGMGSELKSLFPNGLE